MKKTIQLQGLDCASCAAKLENKFKTLPGVKSVQVNFMKQELVLEAPEKNLPEIIASCEAITKKIEPDVKFLDGEKNDGTDADETDDDDDNVPLKLARIIVSIVGLIALHFLALSGTAAFFSYLVLYLLTGYDIVWRAVKNIFHKEIFDENFLMAVATIGALAIGEYPEAVTVMAFYQIGEFFQSYAVNQSRRSIKSLLAIRPDYATIKVNGSFEHVDPETIAVGDVIYVKPGEKVPLDGLILEGTSSVDTSALTGESVPRTVSLNQPVLSGFINQESLLTIKVTKNFATSTVNKILELVENASSQKAPAEQFITKFARYYTPIVVVAAVLLAIVPPLFIGDFSQWLYRALTFLVISCPCALVISVPLSFFGGIGGASKVGILIKGGNYLEVLAKAEVAVFDKTGTLTKGAFALQKINSPLADDDFLFYAASLEQHSNHPIAKAIRAQNKKPLAKIDDIVEKAGYGITARLQKETILFGNEKLLRGQGIDVPQNNEIGTVLYLAIDGQYQGYVVIADSLKPDSKQALADLTKLGIKKNVLLTGDNEKIGQAIGQELGVSDVHSNLLPVDKVTEIEKIMTSGEKTIFVGDGMNDAPVLMRADVGIAMGGLGSDAAIEAADVVIMDDSPSKIPVAIAIARKTMRIVKQNITFALAVKLIVLVLGALGLATMYAAVFADVGVTILAVLNALRALRLNK